MQAWQRLYSRLRAELTAEQERGRRHLELVSQWAHHMKTSVAVIDLELQRLGRSAGAAEVTTALASIGEENQRLSHALQMLLNTVRLQDFAADFKVERVDLPEQVRQLINDHRREFIAHRVYPTLELPAGGSGGEGAGEHVAASPWHWQVETDVKWLRFALEQIVSNAVKYSSRGGVDRGQVKFIIRHDDDEPAVVLEIVNNGIGIPPEDVPRVFNPFFTGAAGRRFPRSTGMGLYLAREVCRRLGHPVLVESTPWPGYPRFHPLPDSSRHFHRFATGGRPPPSLPTTKMTKS